MSPTPVSGLPPEVADARARLGAAHRRLAHAIAGHEIGLDELERATDDIERVAAGFEAGALRDRTLERPTGEWSAAPAPGERMFSFDERPISGRSAPLGFDVEVTRDGDEAVGILTLGRAHEGAPGRSHGGMVSALFDDLFGFILTIHECPGFTGELTVRYEAGTPIGVPLECRVRLDRRGGRKLLMSGELTDVDSGDRYARATAVFIAVDLDAFHAR